MTNFTKLLELTDYADAKAILETVKISESARTLAQTAYQIQETQPTIARNFLKTVIKECEDEEKKIEEVDGGTDTQSSSTTGLEKVGKEDNADESMTQADDTKDQMGVPIGEMAPPMGVPPQIPPQQPPMQYTIQEAKAIRNQFKLIKEAIQNLSKEIKETQNAQTRSLDVGIGFKGTKSTGSFIKETVGDVESARQNIKKLNDAINNGTI